MRPGESRSRRTLRCRRGDPGSVEMVDDHVPVLEATSIWSRIFPIGCPAFSKSTNDMQVTLDGCAPMTAAKAEPTRLFLIAIGSGENARSST